MKFKYKSEIKNRLSEYLYTKRNINTRKLFKCLSPNHIEKNPSMGLKFGIVNCFTCGYKADIYNIIGLDYGLNTFKEQYEKACLIFGLDDDYVKVKYKASMKNIKNDYVNIKQICFVLYKNIGLSTNLKE